MSTFTINKYRNGDSHGNKTVLIAIVFLFGTVLKVFFFFCHKNRNVPIQRLKIGHLLNKKAMIHKRL